MWIFQSLDHRQPKSGSQGRYRRPAPCQVHLFLFFVVLLLIYLKKGDAFPVTPVYLICYSVIRFFDEFLRGDVARGIWGPFSTSQWISLVIFVVTVIYLIASRNKEKDLVSA